MNLALFIEHLPQGNWLRSDLPIPRIASSEPV